MPKSWAQYKTESRARARAGGRCTVCCTRMPEGDNKICTVCKTSNRDRKTRRRAILRERTQLQRIIQAHERAADRAREHHLYADATQGYRRALDIQSIAALDRLRITEKLA